MPIDVDYYVKYIRMIEKKLSIYEQYIHIFEDKDHPGEYFIRLNNANSVDKITKEQYEKLTTNK